MKTFFSNTCFLFAFLSCWSISAQVYEFSTTKDNQVHTHRILMDDHYLVETVFVANPPTFISTKGGYYTLEGDHIMAALEFNSDYEKDSLSKGHWMRDENWKKIAGSPLDLNGKWLMAGRMTDEGERRRDLTGPRKTMKFLIDGHFQWIAFNTASFQFFGSGGGTYTATEGVYTEHIDYFSRDNTRVGASLPFQYLQKGNDWYHKGNSSKGVPMHEIWTKRIP
jgi:hypothetical protein